MTDDASAVLGPSDEVSAAVSELAADRLVAFPTETVWGLAARAESSVATARLFAWKRRATDQPVSVLVESTAGLASLGATITPVVRDLCAAFWPGPLTLVLPCSARLAPGIASATGAVGVRCSPHPLAAALVRAAAAAGLGPLTATSLNRSGDAPAAELASARKAVAGSESDVASPYLLAQPGLDAAGEDPSTVLDLSGERPRVLRFGAIGGGALVSILSEGWDEDGQDGEERE